MREIKLLIGFLFVVFLNGCLSFNEDSLDNPTIIPQENRLFLDVNPKEINIKVGDNFQLYPSVSNAIGPYKIIYSSSNPLVAFVSSEGLIEAKAVGSCTIDVFIEGDSEGRKAIDILVSEKEELSFILTLDGPDTMFVGETQTMQAFDSSNPDNLVFWESMDPSIVIVDGEGRVFGNAPGTTTIKISSYYSGQIFEKEITVWPVIPMGIEITSPDSSVYSPNSEVKLTASILPLNAKQDILWISCDETIAKVNEFGLVTFLKSGEVVIEAKVKEADLRAFITLKVAISPFFVFDNLHVFNPIVQNKVMYWAYSDPNLNQTTNVYGSVSRYLFSDLNIDNTSYWLSSSALNFDQRTFDKPEYIVIHDTWNPSGGGAANAALITSSSNTKTCWHFTVGNDGIYQSLPENQYGKHAGDGGLNFSLMDTMIKADTLNPNITISEDGYWEINYQKTNLLAPLLKDRLATKNDLTDSGILVEINEQRYYVIGTTYYNATYNKIANTGGNAAGIGIETAMNFGSDLYLTWQKTAKLTADLMYRYHLDINRVRQHHFFSGKDCPRTMRKADLWEEFLNLVEGEYLAATNLKGYTVKFISNNPEYVNNWGRIVKLPNVNTKVSYTIQIFLEGDMMGEKTYYSFLQAI